MSSQLREDLESNDDIQVIDNPDSTTSGEGKKKAKKRDRDSDEESDDVSLILARSQVQWKCHCRISSEKSFVVEEEVRPSSSRQRGDSDESEAEEVDGLIRKRNQVEEELAQMKLKVEAMEWEGRARRYHETIQKCVVLFRKVLMNNFGNREDSEQLKEVREDMERYTRTLAKNGFTLRVCEDFIDRVEKTV